MNHVRTRLRRVATCIALSVGGCTVVGPVPALSVAGNTITLTDAEVAGCASGGGCMVVSHKWLNGQLQRVANEAAAAGIEAGVEIGRKQTATNCGSST